MERRISTYFGGETLVNAITVNGSSTAPQTVYTVPSSRYAKVWIQSISRPSVGFPITTTFNIGASVYGPVGTTNEFSAQNFEAILFQGQSVSISLSSSTNYSYYFVIREFSIP
jgi:hypothetical protein